MYVFIVAFIATITAFGVRTKLKNKPSKIMTPEEQKKRDIADQVVIMNETIFRE